MPPDPEAAAAFLLRWSSEILVAAIPPDGVPTCQSFTTAAAEWIRRQNGAGIYFCPNTCLPGLARKPRKADVELLTSVWADLDPDENQEAQPGGLAHERERLHALAGELLALPWPPTAIVSSGSGVQPLWRLANVQPALPEYVAAIETLGRRIEAALGGVQNTSNADRVLRAPFTVNYPNRKKLAKGRGPVPTELLAETGRTYSWHELGQLADHLERHPPAHARPVPLRKPSSKTASHDHSISPPPPPDTEASPLPPGIPTPATEAEVAALLARFPALGSIWRKSPLHAAGWADRSQSSWDLALANVIRDLPDQVIWSVIAAYRLHHDPADRKWHRPDYIRSTIARARDRDDDHDQGPTFTQVDPAPSLTLVQMGAFVQAHRAAEYCIGDIVQRSRLYSLTGLPGHGKSAVALWVSFAKAFGLPLLDREISPGPVVYLAVENPDDICGRVILMADRLAVSSSDAPLHFVSGGFKLSEGVLALSAEIQRIGGAELVIVDTGAALASYEIEDDNANLSMLRFARQLREITEHPGRPTVIALMHPVKGANKTTLIPRGGGSFLAEVDGNLTAWADGAREVVELHWTGKHRGPDFDPVTFGLEVGTCAALADARGRWIPSVWARPITPAMADTIQRAALSDQDNVLMAMRAAPEASLSKLAEFLGWRTGTLGEPNKQRVGRAIEGLAEDGLVVKRRGHWRLTKAGQQEAENVSK